MEKLKPSFEYEVITAFQKDSLEIDDNDRKKLSDLINNHIADRFIITHGTDTMLDTAKYLDEKIKNKLIIITYHVYTQFN